MKLSKIAIYVLIPGCLLLTSCGRKMPPKPAEGSEITYPCPYPKPEC